jgi:hypothetical protein
MRWAGYVPRLGNRRDVHSALLGKPDGKRPLRRHRCRYEYDIKIRRKEIGWECVDWIGLVLHRDELCALVNTVMKLGIL